MQDCSQNFVIGEEQKEFIVAFPNITPHKGEAIAKEAKVPALENRRVNFVTRMADG